MESSRWSEPGWRCSPHNRPPRRRAPPAARAATAPNPFPPSEPFPSLSCRRRRAVRAFRSGPLTAGRLATDGFDQGLQIFGVCAILRQTDLATAFSARRSENAGRSRIEWAGSALQRSGTVEPQFKGAAHFSRNRIKARRRAADCATLTNALEAIAAPETAAAGAPCATSTWSQLISTPPTSP